MLVDRQPGVGVGDRRDDLDHVVGGIEQRHGVAHAAGGDGTARALLVERLQRVADDLSRIAPFLGERLELVEILGDRRVGAALIGELELVVDLGALDVGREHPLFVHPLVGDHQRAPLTLLEDLERVEVVAERLVAEAVPVEVDDDAVLAVVEGQLDELERVRVRHVRRDQMPVEAGPRQSEAGPGGLSQPQAITGAVGVRAQREVARVRVDVLRAQLGIAAETAGRQQRRARMNGAHALGGPDDRAGHGAVLDQQALGRGAGQQLAVLADQALARQQIVRHVGAAAAAVPEDRDRIADVGAE